MSELVSKAKIAALIVELEAACNSEDHEVLRLTVEPTIFDRVVFELRGLLADREAAEERMREAEATLQVLADAVGHMRVPQTIAEAALQLTVTLGPALARARAFLSTGKPSKAKETA